MKARVIPGASRGVEESAREGPRPTAREIPRWRHWVERSVQQRLVETTQVQKKNRAPTKNLLLNKHSVG